jgi:dimethylhistidine N-methyltransferase
VSRPAVALHDEAQPAADFRAAVLAGLERSPRTVPPKFFYDRRGSEFFERICRLPEYYLTRTETGILGANAAEMARLIGPLGAIIEPGCGAAQKVRLLLGRLRPLAYVGIDIARDGLTSATRRLAADHPWLQVHAVCADLCGPLAQLTLPLPRGRRVAFYPGSSIGNFEADDAVRFLERVRGLTGPDGMLLIGIDLRKDPAILHAAYNDSQGITARFNLNLLHRMRRELGAAVDVEGFAHQASYNAQAGRIEMHLVSRRRQQIRIDGRSFEFAPGDAIHTENSYKYDIPEFERLASAAGWDAEASWRDAANYCAVLLLRCR